MNLFYTVIVIIIYILNSLHMHGIFAKVFIHKNCITNFKKHKNIIILYNILAKLSKIEDIFVVFHIQ